MMWSYLWFITEQGRASGRRNLTGSTGAVCEHGIGEGETGVDKGRDLVLVVDEEYLERPRLTEDQVYTPI